MKKSTTAIAVVAVFALFAGSLLVSSVNRASAESANPSFSSFCVGSPSVCGTIVTDVSGNSITITVPYGTDVTGLFTNFTFNGAEVWANGVRQYNGDSIMNFSSPVVYTIFSCPQTLSRAKTGMRIATITNSNYNGNTNSNENTNSEVCLSASYEVSVTVAPKPVKEITSFGFATPSATGTIDQETKKISVTVPYGTDVTALTPTVVYSGNRLRPDTGEVQDFSSPVTYTIDYCKKEAQAIRKTKIAFVEDCGVSYVVTVKVAAAPPSGGGGSSGGSGWEDPSCRTAVVAPIGGFVFVGENGANVSERKVTLKIDGGNAVSMSISNNVDFSGATIEPYAKTKVWELTEGEGSKLVYVRFYNKCNIPTDTFLTQFSYTTEVLPQIGGVVLGVKVYAEGTLLRGTDHRIYELVLGHLKYIHSLEELAKYYFGKPIIDVSDDVIASFGF